LREQRDYVFEADNLSTAEFRLARSVLAFGNLVNKFSEPAVRDRHRVGPGQGVVLQSRQSCF
jgi:hypothetical protein